MEKPPEFKNYITMTEAAEVFNVLKTKLEHWWRFGILKPDAIRLRGSSEWVSDPKIIHDQEALRKMGKRYEFYFEKESLRKQIENIQYLQQEKRLKIWEIKEVLEKK